MPLPVKKNYRPMEALPATELPAGPEWQYEPKWDGFRCLAFRDGKRVDLQSKSGKPLTRYFPELVAALEGLKPNQRNHVGQRFREAESEQSAPIHQRYVFQVTSRR